MSYKALRQLRIALSLLLFAAITFLCVDYSGYGSRFLSVLVGWQLVPAALAFSVFVLVFWMFATVIFGRIYCSSICPMGTLQDIIARMNRRRTYRYRKPIEWLRSTVLAVMAVGIVCGIAGIPALLNPYSQYARIAEEIIKPIYGWCHNGILWIGNTSGLWEMPMVKIVVASSLGLVIAIVTLLIVGILAWRGGRTFCNTICPVGTALGIFSRNSIWHVEIDTDKCIHCGKCESACKASCINPADSTVDTSRCVTCFNCMPVCPNDAITYTPRRKQLSIPMMQRITPDLSQGITKAIESPTAQTATQPTNSKQK